MEGLFSGPVLIMDDQENQTGALSSQPYSHELAGDVVALLRGNPCPAAPTEIPEWFCRGIDRDIVRRNWGAYALQQFAILNLSHEQKRFLNDLGKLEDIGSDFFQYIVNDKGMDGGTKQPVAVEILRADSPESMLAYKFHTYLNNDVHGPFPRSAKWKLKKRFDQVLENHPDLFRCDQGLWTLSEEFEPATWRPEPAVVMEHLERTIGALTPDMYKGDESRRADKLISIDEGLRVAETAIRFAGPQSTATLADWVVQLWTCMPWHEEASDQTLDVLYKEPATSDAEEEAATIPGLSQIDQHPLPPAQGERKEFVSPHFKMQDSGNTVLHEAVMQEIWERFPPRYKAVLACHDAVTGREYTLKELDHWTRTHPGPWGVIKKSMGCVYRSQLIPVLREHLSQIKDQTDIEQIYTYFLQQARKLHETPASGDHKEDRVHHE